MWGGGDIAIATGGWAASRAAAGRVRAGPDIRRGAAAALVGAARAAGSPAGTVRSPARAASGPSAPRRGPGQGGARPARPRGLEELHSLAGSKWVPPRRRRRRGRCDARHLCLHRPPEKFVVRSRMAPLFCGFSPGAQPAAMMALLLPTAAVPRDRSVRHPHLLLLARAPGARPAAGNQRHLAPERSLGGTLGWALGEEQGVGVGAEGSKRVPTPGGITRRIGSIARGMEPSKVAHGGLKWAS
jgi:hypothetical protein